MGPASVGRAVAPKTCRVGDFPVRRGQRSKPRHATVGEVAEWSNAPHSKCGVLVRVPGVRIPPSPPNHHVTCHHATARDVTRIALKFLKLLNNTASKHLDCRSPWRLAARPVTCKRVGEKVGWDWQSRASRSLAMSERARGLYLLSATAVKNITDPGWHADGGGLFLEVDAGGTRKRWALRLTVAGKRRDFGIGPLHKVSLLQARETAARYIPLPIRGSIRLTTNGVQSCNRRCRHSRRPRNRRIPSGGRPGATASTSTNSSIRCVTMPSPSSALCH